MSEDGPNPGYMSRKIASAEEQESRNITVNLKGVTVTKATYDKRYLLLSLSNGTVLQIAAIEEYDHSGNKCGHMLVLKRM